MMGGGKEQRTKTETDIQICSDMFLIDKFLHQHSNSTADIYVLVKSKKVVCQLCGKFSETNIHKMG